MNDVATRYLTEIVDPTISDLEANPTSVRHAFLACVAAYHTVDYLAHPKKPGNELKGFRDTSAEFAIVDRVAHAFKHVKAGDERDQHRSSLRYDNVIERPPARCGQMVCGLSRLGDDSGGKTIQPEIDRDILTTVKKAAEFLRAKATA